MDWNEINVKSTSLSFVNSDDELKRLFTNSIIFSDLMKKHEPTHLSHYLENTQYGYTTSASENGQYRFLRITDIQEGSVNWDTVPYCDCNRPDKYLLAKDDILIARTGGTTGKSFLIKESPNNAVFASYLIRLRLRETVNPGFISLYLNSYLFWTQILELKSGSAQPNVNAKKLEALLVPKINLQQQREIFETIVGIKPHTSYATTKGLIARSESNFVRIKGFGNELTHQQTLLKQLRQAILQEAVQGKLTEPWRAAHPEVEPASALLERIQAEKARLVKEKKIKKSKLLPPISPNEIPFHLPKGWVWCRLGEVFETTSGGTPQRGNPEFWKNGTIGWLKSGELNDGYIQNRPEESITDYALTKSSTVLFSKGTLLMAMYGATAGKLGILTYPSSTNQAICGFFPNDQVHKIFLFNFLISIRKKMISDSWGQAQPNISQSYIRSIVFPLPPLAEQKAIVEKVESLLAKVSQLEQEVQQNQRYAEQLLQSVLREVMRPVQNEE